MVREAAEAACKDGAGSPQLRKLASLGGPHAPSRNMRRDCLNNLDITFVEPEMAKLPMMPAKGEKKERSSMLTIRSSCPMCFFSISMTSIVIFHAGDCGSWATILLGTVPER